LVRVIALGRRCAEIRGGSCSPRIVEHDDHLASKWYLTKEAEMIKKLVRPAPPRGYWRWLARFPIIFYCAGLGWILGQRFVHLIHVGRRSGLERHVVLEVVRRDTATNTYYVASGWGRTSNWYRNVRANPHLRIQVGGKSWDAVATRVAPAQATEVLLDYARRHPLALKAIAYIMGYRIDGTQEDIRALGREIPIIAIQPDCANR
jgi:deazaflavin-dependent oxidoreductase (nitroreductase family)